MRKCVTLFERDPETHRVLDRVAAGAEWAAAGEGVATLKWDGTCCAVIGGKLHKRYDGSKSKHLPADFVPADGAESHWLGWRPVGDGPEDRWHQEAWRGVLESNLALEDGTYELVGPKVNKNPDGVPTHQFRRHGDVVFADVPRDYSRLREWLTGRDLEGVVFHHPDGRLVKIKGRDFGLRRPERAEA
jgi:hypothetical protein